MTGDGRGFPIVGSREAPDVPAGCQYPRTERGRYVPLLPFGCPAEDNGGRMMPPLAGERVP